MPLTSTGAMLLGGSGDGRGGPGDRSRLSRAVARGDGDPDRGPGVAGGHDVRAGRRPRDRDTGPSGSVAAKPLEAELDRVAGPRAGPLRRERLTDLTRRASSPGE